MASSGLAHVLLPAETIAQSPSQADGVERAVEQSHRFWGCELIEEAGILLRLPQVVMVTAQTMLHRFYYRKSLRDFDAFRVAIGCLFLAAKVEEQPKPIKDVLSVFYAIYRRRKWGKTKLAQQLLELESESYYLWRDWLIIVERQILIDLGFSLYNIMEHPHKYILYYIKILDGSKDLAQRAWGFLNDSLRVDLCVRYRAEVIACAAIFISARQLQVKLPDKPMWFELFNVDRDSLVVVATEILQLYNRDKTIWLDALTKVDPFAVDDKPDAEEPVVETIPADPTVTASNKAESRAESTANKPNDIDSKEEDPTRAAAVANETVTGDPVEAEAAATTARAVGGGASAAGVVGAAAAATSVVGVDAVGAAREGVRNAILSVKNENNGMMVEPSSLRSCSAELTMEPDTELDAALIDAFDAESAPPRSSETAGETLRRKAPFLATRGGLKHAETMVAMDRSQVGALCHYPSLDALESPAKYVPYVPSYTHTVALSQSPVVAPAVQYPRLEPIPAPTKLTKVQPNELPTPTEKIERAKSEPATKLTSTPEQCTPKMVETGLNRRALDPAQRDPCVYTLKAERAEPEDVADPVASPEQCASVVTSMDLKSQVFAPSGPDGVHPHDSVRPAPEERLPTDEEMEIQRRQLQAEVARFEEQARYMALALAGETPHQIEMRRQREEERKEREERRIAAVEIRMEHMIERETQREARMAERRQRHMECSHRSSVSPSPERDCSDEPSPEEKARPSSPLHGNLQNQTT